MWARTRSSFGVVDMHAGVQAGAGQMGLAGAAVNKSPNKPDQSYRNRSAYLV